MGASYRLFQKIIKVLAEPLGSVVAVRLEQGRQVLDSVAEASCSHYRDPRPAAQVHLRWPS
jgi:hypothetical protein